MKKILFLTNSEALKNLVTKNKNYEFDFCENEEKLNEILRRKKSEYALLLLDEIVTQNFFENLPAISFFPEQENFGQIHLITKPIHITDLFGKIDDLTPEPQAKIFNFENCVINLDSRFLQKNNDSAEIKLTELETKILNFFLEKNDEGKTKSKILNEVWGYKNSDQMTDTGIVEVTLNKLRKKLKGFGVEELVSLKIN